MMRLLPLPGPCRLCGNETGHTSVNGWACGVCGWVYGDVPDPELPLPVIEIVYYLRFEQRVKIGTSRRPRQRLAAIRHDELLAFERGGRSVEQQRHRDFAALREGGEWFTFRAPLAAHIASVRAQGAPWDLYARWFAAALQGDDERG